jgi:hypothetical protein
VTATLTNTDPAATRTNHHAVRTREQAVGRPADNLRSDLYGPLSARAPHAHHRAGVGHSTAQLTVTACLLGLASDRSSPAAARHRRPALAADRRHRLAPDDGQRYRRHLPARDLPRPGELPRHRRHRILPARARPLRVRCLATPLVGLGDAVPLGLVTVVSAALSMTAYTMTIGRTATSTGSFTARAPCGP